MSRLRVFSCFTMLEGAIEPKAIAKHAKRLGFPAARWSTATGCTRRCRSATPASAKASSRSSARCWASRAPPTSARAGTIDWLVLLAQDEAGYANLCRLVSAHLDRPISEEPHVALDALDGATDGLIALTAGGEGAIARLFADGQDDKAKTYADRLRALFPDRLYIELSRRGDAVEQAAEAALIDLAYAPDLPLVATNPACYAEPEFPRRA